MPDTHTGAAAEFEARMAPVAPGLRLEVRDYAPAAPQTGAPVICLHGLTRNARDFELVGARIAALGRRVLAISMRGRGGSDRDPDPAHYQPLFYARDVVAVMDQARIPHAVFVGTSMGGIISMLIAQGAPQRVAAAVLNDVGPVLDPAGLQRIAGYVGKGGQSATWEAAAEAVKAVQGVAFPARAEDADFWMTFARRTWRQIEPGRIEPDYDPMIALALAEPPREPLDLMTAYRALAKRPVLVVRGAISDLLSRDGLEQMRAMKPGLATVEVEDVGHAPTLEEDASWMAVLDFLARAP
jgi:pimeloyl-ACP methyl ester carboxylesterase